MKAKDVMSFIITGENGGSAEKAAQNAFTLDEVVKADSGLKPGKHCNLTVKNYFIKLTL